MNKTIDANLKFIHSFPYIAIEGADIKMNSCISRNDKEKKFHSSCEQILVFGKKQIKLEQIKNLNIKSTYTYSVQRDSAFWPQDLVKDLISPFALRGKILLDPFMGSGTIANLVVEHGGKFIGYDIDGDTLKTYGWI